MATKQMAESFPAPVALMGLGTTELIDIKMKPPVAKRKARSNGKGLSDAGITGIYQNHRSDMAMSGTDVDIVLL